LPGIGDLINSFQSEVESASDSFLQTGLAKDAQKTAEKEAFEAMLHHLRTTSSAASVVKVETFNRSKKRLLNELAGRPQIEAADLAGLFQHLATLTSDLMDLELRQVEHFDEILNEFENKFMELKQASLDAQQGFFRIIEEHENNYTRDLMQLVSELLEKAAKDDLPADLPDEAAALLSDRDTALNAVTSSHDVHVGKLYKREDEAKTNEEHNCKSTVRFYRDAEHERSRSRIVELKDFEKRVTIELNDLISVDLDDDLDGEPE